MRYMPDFAPFIRCVNYYETDKMAIVHHSNYIRYFEEARIDLMRRNGLDYAELEHTGISIPVTDVSCKYIASARFDSVLHIHARLIQFTGVRFALAYQIRFPDGTLCATGESHHCFLDMNTNRPVSLKRRFPEVYQQFQLLLKASEQQPL